MNANDPILNESLAMDAIETAWNGLNSYEGTKSDPGLQSLVRVLWAAGSHFGNKEGRTQETREAFYEELANLICEGKMDWMCDMHTPELLAAMEKRARTGNEHALEFLRTKYTQDCLDPKVIHKVPPRLRMQIELSSRMDEAWHKVMLPGFY